MASKSISVGPFGLGDWIYDCAQLKSTLVHPSKDPVTGEVPNILATRIEIGPTLASLGAWLVSAVQSLLGQGQATPVDQLGSSVDRDYPGFEGTVVAHLWAKGESVPCDPNTNKQSVRWVWFASVRLEGSANAGILKLGGFATFLLGPFQGETIPCDCNRELGFLRLHDYGTSALALLPPAAASIFGVAHEGAGGPTITLVAKQSELADLVRSNSLRLLPKEAAPTSIVGHLNVGLSEAIDANQTKDISALASAVAEQLGLAAATMEKLRTELRK